MPILQRRCQGCHRPGEIGPFPLMSIDHAKKYAKRIREAVTTRRMPPWHANPEHGEWSNDARLSDAEIATIQNWIDGGMKQGGSSPPARQFTSGWQIGKPDLVLKIPAFKGQAEGTIPYRYVTVDPKLKEDVWVQAIEVRPGARPVVHHILVFTGGAQGEFAGGLNGYFGAMVPGEEPMMLPEGYAKKLKAGEQLTVQLHYNATGEAYSDESSIGLKFARKGTVKKEVHTRAASSMTIAIPPGAADHRESGTFRFARDSMLLSFQAHMHLRGKAFRYEATYPDGKTEILLDMPEYDFNWQLLYKLKKPKLMPAGTTIRATGRFDNSKNNPANPDPSKWVRFGEQTWDEMMIGYFDYYEGRE
jgi:hypothetical protein